MEKGSPDLGRDDIKIIGATIALGGFETFADMAEEVKRLAAVYPKTINQNIAAYACRIAECEE